MSTRVSSRLALIACLSFASPLAAQETASPASSPASSPAAAPSATQALTYAALLASIEAHFPLIVAAESGRDVADAELLAAEGSFDPTWRTRAAGLPVGYYNTLSVDSVVAQPTQLWGAQLFAGWRYGQGLSYTGIPAYDGKIETLGAGELRAGVSVPLWRNGPIDRARANIRRAEQGRVVAEMTALQQRLEATRGGAQRYWEWVAAGRRLEVVRELLALATDRDAALGRRVSEGDLPRFERTDNMRAIVQREGIVVTARRQLEQAAIELSLYLRDDRGASRIATEAELPGVLPEPVELAPACVSREVARAMSRRPEPRRFEAQRERERIERDWADNQRRPAVDVSVAVSHDLGGGPQRLDGPILEAGVVLDIPLATRTATGRSRAASAAMSVAEQQRRFALDRVRADIRDAMSALEAARQRVGVARRELALSRELAGLERQRLLMGDGTLLVVNIREQAATEAAVREVDAMLDWQRALAAWRFATGNVQREGSACAP